MFRSRRAPHGDLVLAREHGAGPCAVQSQGIHSVALQRQGRAHPELAKAAQPFTHHHRQRTSKNLFAPRAPLCVNPFTDRRFRFVNRAFSTTTTLVGGRRGRGWDVTGKCTSSACCPLHAQHQDRMHATQHAARVRPARLVLAMP